MKADKHDILNQLLDDHSFVTWVQSDFVFDDDIWSTYIDNHPDAVEDINTAIRFVRSLQFEPEPVVNEEALWQRISADVSESGMVDHPATSFRLQMVRLRWAVAACMVVLLAALWLFPSSTTVATGAGEQSTVALPDKSSVLLGAVSSLRFEEESWNKTRTVTLEGTAFFTVAEGSRFDVVTSLGTVSVLGTSFSVQARDKRLEVICRTGKVEVRTKNGGIQVMLPGDKVVSDADASTMNKIQLDSSEVDVPWLIGMYTFENAPLQDVVTELERQYDVRIRTEEALLDRRYTGFFNSGNLDSALQSVFWPLNLQYEVKGKQVILKTK